MVPILLVGLSESDPVPGVYFDLRFAVGPAGNDNGEMTLLFIGNKTSEGDAVVDTEIYGPRSSLPLITEADWIARFGKKSELFRMFLASRIVTPNLPRSAIAVTESAGAAAVGTITFTGTASGSGSYARIFVGRDYVDVPISSGDTPTVIATAAAAAINQQAYWPVTATSAAGVVTITAAQKGPRGNFLRYMAQVFNYAGSAVSPTADTAFSSGTTADSFTAALATIAAKTFYYVVSPSADTSQNNAILAQLANAALPLNGNRVQRLVSGSVDTLGTVTAAGISANGARAEIAWHEKCPWTPSEIAAHAATNYLLMENADQTSFVGYGNDAESQPLWSVPASRVTTSHPGRVAVATAINNGISPIAVNDNGSTYLVDRVTTRTLSGAIVDYRIRDAHKVTVMDKFALNRRTAIALRFPRHRVCDDPPVNQTVEAPRMVWPRLIKNLMAEGVDQFKRRGLIERAEETKAAIIAQRETSPTTRITALVDLHTIDNLKQVGFVTNQVS